MDGSTYNEVVADEKPVETPKQLDVTVIDEAAKIDWIDASSFYKDMIAKKTLEMQAHLQSTMLFGYARTAYRAQPSQKEIDAAAARALRAARDLIKHPVNWTKGVSTRSTCLGVSYCSVGAIAEAAPVVSGYNEVCDRACYYLAKAAGLGCGSNIPSWNDCHARTHAEVIMAFNRAIHLAEGGK